MDLIRLCEIPAISGREELLRAELRKECIRLLGEENVRIDKAGNLIAHQEGNDASQPSVTLLAHMDEVGLMCVSASDEGLLRIRPIGNVDTRMLISKRVHVGYPAENQKVLNGVIGATAIHLQTAEDRKNVLSADQIYVDIGAKDKDEAFANAPIGTPVSFASPAFRFGRERIAAKALPSRAGVWNLLRLMEQKHLRSVDYVFASQAEVGGCGAMGAAYALKPSQCIILDAALANDGGETPECEQICALEKGVCIGFADKKALFSPAFYNQVLTLAEETNIPHQVLSAFGTGDDSGSVQRNEGGVQVLTLSVPARNLFSPLCICSLKDIEAQYALLCAFLENEGR